MRAMSFVHEIQVHHASYFVLVLINGYFMNYC